MKDKSQKSIRLKTINKIIYFDKETISNILQEQDRGTKQSQFEITTSNETSSELSAEADIEAKLEVPFVLRLKFLFSSKLNIKEFIRHNNSTTITSTEISDFERLKPFLKKIVNAQLLDIKNSSTSYRTLGYYSQMMSDKIEGLDIKEFNSVMDSYDGYDTYDVGENTFVRFNNSAFLSNYKRNDILTTKMTLY